MKGGDKVKLGDINYDIKAAQPRIFLCRPDKKNNRTS